MKVVILAGGYGSRLSEETSIRPKPLVKIGEQPILWHIMKIYSFHGIHDFIICCGYKGYMIKDYFSRYFLHRSDITIDLTSNKIEINQNKVEPWRITLVDTGNETMTGGRLQRVRPYLDDETFCLTYGDGVSDVDLTEAIAFHQGQRTLATVTAVQPPGRFGVFSLSKGQNKVSAFREKPRDEGAWINGGFFVLQPGVFDYIVDDSTVWEHEPLQQLAQDGQLSAYRHYGFWHPMDTLRDKSVLEEMWLNGKAPWQVW